MLDKLTYAGRHGANLEGRRRDPSSRSCTATSPTPTRSPTPRATATRSSTSRPRRTSTARSSARPTSGAPSSSATQVLLEQARRAAACASCRSRPTRSTANRGGRLARRPTRSSRRARTASPRPPATCSCRAYVRRTASTSSITRGSNNYGPNQYPEKLIPLFVTNALEDKPLPVYGDGRQIATGSTSRTTAAAIEHVLDARARRRGVQRRRRRRARRTSTSRRDPRRARRQARRCIKHVEDRPGHDRRYASTAPSCARSAGRRAVGVRGGARTHRRLVPRTAATGGSRSSRASSEAYYERQYAARLAAERAPGRPGYRDGQCPRASSSPSRLPRSRCFSLREPRSRATRAGRSVRRRDGSPPSPRSCRARARSCPAARSS